jgi:AmmeMemoRadiSam system protein A
MGDKKSSGGFMEKNLTAEDKSVLLKLARDAIVKFVTEGKRIGLPPAEGIFGEMRGAFVTIHKRGMLRGCIGNMVGIRPLAETIREMAIAAATGDPRFNRLSEREIPDIDIEISVLSTLKRISDLSEIVVGEHGILMKRGYSQGVLLPQVATEFGWNREEFLENTCYKAGLPGDAWRDPETDIEIFSADVFGEKEQGLWPETRKNDGA